MAEDKPDTQAEGHGAPKPGRLVPVLLGAILVVGGAIGVVALTAPKGDHGVKKVDLDSLEAVRYDDRFDWTFNLAGKGPRGMGRLKVSFDYKAADRATAQKMIQRGWDKARSEIQILLLAKSKDDLSSPAGAIQLKQEILERLGLAFFPSSQGKISDVYILELICQ